MPRLVASRLSMCGSISFTTAFYGSYFVYFYHEFVPINGNQVIVSKCLMLDAFAAQMGSVGAFAVPDDVSYTDLFNPRVHTTYSWIFD